MRHLKLFVLFLVLAFSQGIKAQLSTKHYIPPITSDNNDQPAETYIYISTPKNNVAFTITPVGHPDKKYSATVSNNTPFLYRIVEDGQDPTSSLAFLDVDGNTQFTAPEFLSNTVISDRGYIIEANDVIYTSVRFRAVSTFHAGALVSKGLSGLGTTFRVGAFVREEINQPGGFLNFASVMATEDNTSVTFGDFPTGIKIINHTGNAPINTTLNKGESYFIAVSIDNGGNPNDIVGTLIESDKPIVVNTGSLTGSFSTGANGRDYGVDQIVGFSKVGDEYIFVRGNGGTSPIGDEWENVLIVAHEDNTEIYVNGQGTPQNTINAGEYHIIEGSFFTGGNMHVKTSKPVFAYQGVGGDPNSPANQGMFFVPPLSCENKGNVNNIAAIDRIGDSGAFNGGITIVTKSGATVTINDSPINSFSTSGPFSVTGNNDYVTYKVTGLSGNVKVESTDELYCAYYNRNGFASSGSFYSGFPSPPEINFNTQVATLGNCIPNVTLIPLNTDLFDSFEWYFDDGNGFVATGNTSASYTPTQSGNYKLVATISCSGNPYESTVIPVSLCPDDYDNDLIIDNIDIDLDNDGLTNCDESLGDVRIDFTDINQPALNFLDNTTNNSFVSSALVQNGTSTLSGDSLGNFTSEITADINSDLEYKLSFTNPSNIEFSNNSAITHTNVSGESFILKIGPSSKNITIIDPDNILLVDTNFDGVYETGVNYYSSSEIHFQLNPTPNGTTPFKIVGHHVEEVIFIHKLSNINDNSSFSGNLKLTCFAKDSDNDGVEDALDLDSDNDGIPDLVEVSGAIITLSGNDDNLDGLDNLFTNPLVAVDSDNDGIPDYLDVDSDNDGIFDVFEAGHNLADTNFDGVIDNASTTVGVNGLVNSLETSADNGVLSYTISDIDADNLISSIDLDADGDGCSDVIEAGFLDPDADDKIGTSPVQVNAVGKVINIPDGYTLPHVNYNTSSPIILNTAFEDVAFCEASTSTISIDSTADAFQWEVSSDNGNNWSTITDNATYSGATTKDLQIINLPLSFDGYQFRVNMNRNGNSCGDTSNIITLTVEPLPIINNAVELKQCDDDTDGFSSFNLFEAASDISTNYQNETFEFYPTLVDAQAGTNIIVNSTTFENRTVTTDKVWARAISAFGCYRISEVTLTVSTTGIPSNFKRTFTVCDDYLDINGNDTQNNDDKDGVSSFDFSSVTAEIKALFPPNQQLVISYYRNEADALQESNPITDTSNYRNIGYPTTQDIYVRVDSELNNDCLGLGPHITLNVTPTPTANQVNDLELCDDLNDGDGFNGIVQSFDLASQTSTILGVQDPNDYTVTYHTSAIDANTGNNPIINTSSFENTTKDRQTIYVRVENNNAGCFDDHLTFDLIVHPLPVANFVEDLEICDDNSDGSAQNGFSQSFNLELQTPGILGTQDPNTYSVTYHISLADAQSGNNSLASPFSNSVQNEQLIWVRVFNSTTGCANGISNFKVIVNSEPTNENISNLSYCDNNSDGDDTSGIITTIDLHSTISSILGTNQDVDDFNVTFHESQQEATDGLNPLSSPYTNTVAHQQTIYVRIENKDTGCVNDNLSFDVIINPLPDFQVTTPQLVCLNGPPLTLEVENPSTTYDYIWTDPNGGQTNGDSITITTGGLYTITATTTNGTNCTRTREIQVNESIVATISNDDVTIVDDSENNSITINTVNLGIGDYEYALEDENGNTIRFFQDEPLFEMLEGGIYNILVRDKNGCGTANLLVSVIEFPKFFTPNADGDNDTWIIKGVSKTFYRAARTEVFDRFGKVLTVITEIEGNGWNGTYNGNKLPSNDYWFNIVLEDINGNIRKRVGHFSLLRK